MQVMCLGNFYDLYKDNYQALGISTNLDFNKLHEYFKQKIKYFDLFLKTENIIFPKDLHEFTAFIEKVKSRLFNRRFGSVTDENENEFFNKYPEINDFLEDNLSELKLHPDNNQVPSVFSLFSIKELEDKETRARNAAICFCDAMPDLILFEDIYAMFKYAAK